MLTLIVLPPILDRVQKKKLNIDPKSLIPKLPNPDELRYVSKGRVRGCEHEFRL